MRSFGTEDVQHMVLVGKAEPVAARLMHQRVRVDGDMLVGKKSEALGVWIALGQVISENGCMVLLAVFGSEGENVSC